MNIFLRQAILTTNIILILYGPAAADVAFPTLAWVLPPAWLLLFPVILLEAMIGQQKYAIPPREALKAASVANIVSTIFGVPIAWLIFSLIPDFLTTYVNNSMVADITPLLALPFWVPNGYWAGNLSVLLGLLLFFLLSVLIEYKVACKFLKNIEKQQVKRWAWLANAASYILLGVIVFYLPHIKSYTPFAINLADFIMTEIPRLLGI